MNSKSRVGTMGVWMAAGLAVAVFGSISLAQADQPDQTREQPSAAKPATPAGDAPEITFDEKVHEFGVISDDKNVNYQFKFKNTGKGTLTISNTQGSCGCTVPQLEKKEYAPGEEGLIKVEYHPQNRNGPQHTTVTVTSNDPTKPQVVLEIKSDVRPLVAIEPKVLNIGQVPKGKAQTLKAVITSRLPDVKIVSATPTIAAIDAKVGPGQEADVNGEKVMQFPIEITVPATAPVGQVIGNVAIRTSDAARLLNLTVTGEVVGDIVPNPARVQLGALQPGQTFTSELRLSSRNGKPFKVTKVEEQSGTPGRSFSDIQVKEDTNTTPPSYVVTMTGTAPTTPGAVRGDLLISSDLEGESQFKVQYFGFIRQLPQTPAQPRGFEGDSTLVPGPR
ncbi:MAG: DUF1573 domain-containing protein [Tepidisphaera sp.]|nr:DUF1573 domain-containing protein [Tepidisphaera sp.]